MWAEMTLFYAEITIISPIENDDFNLVLKFDCRGETRSTGEKTEQSD